MLRMTAAQRLESQTRCTSAIAGIFEEPVGKKNLLYARHSTAPVEKVFIPVIDLRGQRELLLRVLRHHAAYDIVMQ